MPPRRACFWVGLLLLGTRPAWCGEPPAAQRLWQQGQKAMLDGHPEEALPCYRESLRLDPGLARNHLSLAAALLAQGQDEQAAPHLDRYLQAQPDHLVIRAHYAELLLRLARPREAREQFDRFVADVQDHETLSREHLVHCHSRLMEIAQGENDPYGEHLHRGIGLYLLARRRVELADTAGGLSAEALLCKAAAELTLARMERPEEARPWWYLYEVWTSLAQQQPASRCLRAAAAAAPLSYLTPVERRSLQLARLGAARDAGHK
jgi:tetratricopeptide (TPR) repeat protein